MDSAAQSLTFVLALIVMAFGTLAAALPVVPGPALVWFAAVIYAIVTGFKEIGPIPLILLTLLMILGSTTNLWMSALGMKATGGSFLSVIGGTIGMFAGLIILFPIGALIGAIVGAVGVEILRGGDWRKALKIGGGTAGGYLLGVVVEFLIATVMDLIFILSLALAYRGG